MQRLLLLVCVLAVALVNAEEKCQDGARDQCPSVETTRAPFNQNTDWSKATSIYDFHAKDIHGNDVSLEKYKGHVCIIVNVASQCSLTDSNYEGLVELYEKYKEKEGLRILAFPSNQFGGQEPGSSEEILDFIKKFNVKFDVFEKVDVNGENAHPLWKWLKSQSGGFLTDSIKWNFTKFVINKQGKPIHRYSPTTDPSEMEASLKEQF